MFFGRSIADSKSDLAEYGYVHLQGAASQELLAYLLSLYDTCQQGAQNDLPNAYVKGKKKQYLFDFPDADGQEDFRAQVCKLVGYEPEKLTISERHIKAYDDDAEEVPAPHKERSASTYSIGIPIKLTEGTSVCFFPQLDRTPNADDRAFFLKDLPVEEVDSLYESDACIRLNEAVGDIIVFEGSALYHERLMPAGSVVLYIKINDQGWDPLGENVFANEQFSDALMSQV